LNVIVDAISVTLFW